MQRHCGQKEFAVIDYLTEGDSGWEIRIKGKEAYNEDRAGLARYCRSGEAVWIFPMGNEKPKETLKQTSVMV